MDSPRKTKKGRSRSMSRGNSGRLFRCFKPAVVEDADDGRGDLEERGPGVEPLFAYVAVKEDDGRFVQEIPVGGEGDDGSDDRGKKEKKKKKGSQLLSRASKAIFFEKYLAKKIQNKKNSGNLSTEAICRRNSLESISNLSTEAERILKLMHQNSGGGVSDNDSVRVTDSSVSTSSHSSVVATTSPSLSSSRSSSMSSLLRARTQSSTQSSSFNSKQIQLGTVEDSKEPPSSSDNSAICLLLLTLLVLVLWGKVCAIVCTSTWLLFVPRWSIVKRPKSPLESGDDSSDVNSAEYKKKIILQGLLQRKRLSGAQPF